MRSLLCPQNGKSVIFCRQWNTTKLLSMVRNKNQTRGRTSLRFTQECRSYMYVNHLACIYSFKRKVNKRPVVLFFNMLDTAVIASFVISMCNNPKSSKAIRRRQFIVSLGECLAEPLLRRRLHNASQLRSPIMSAIQLLQLDSGETEPGTERPARLKTQGRWHMCPGLDLPAGSPVDSRWAANSQKIRNNQLF